MRASRARDSLWALAIGVAALALYLATLQPDFGGPEDTPKFQFLGYVLGTAHPPGYPLYVLLSHFFVKLPIRTIAYRANLFSAVMAAVACALAYAIARQLAESTRCYTLFATHYFELTQLATQIPNVANVHLDAVEHKDRIVFLHKLEGGPADRSYGIHVAHLAGIPKDVIRAARRHLGELEKQLRPGSAHPDLFATAPAPVAAEPEEDALREALAGVHPDELSPREALEVLYRLKKAADE